MSVNSLSAELTYTSYCNLVWQQNAVPLVRELKLINCSGKDLSDLRCTFSAVPEFIKKYVIPVELLKSGGELCIDKVDLSLDCQMLANLSEGVKCSLKLSVSSGEEQLFEQEYDCEVLAPDQWTGILSMPELLASFVTPNLEIIAHLQSLTAAELEKITGSSAIRGYQSDAGHVYEVCGAIYRVLHDQGIQYSNPAASFGVPGQRIRFADTICRYKLGTCLDTALLFASVMEACGLHPVIMLQEGHAFIGCHLTERYFPDILTDDLQTIRKLADLDEFLVLETTSITGSSTFAKAEAHARMNYLNQENKFKYAIDVVRARLCGIRPLPLKRSVNGMEFPVTEREIAPLKVETARRLEKEIDLSHLSDGRPQNPRVASWTKKLLDLSLRNRLLNVRNSKLVIPIVCPDIAKLEDRISDNEVLICRSMPELTGEYEQRELAMLRNSNITTDVKNLLERELEQRRLNTFLTESEMSRRLTALYRQGKTDIEEGGVNTLFLALGFLEWKNSERENRSFLAPIMLLPVRMTRKSIAEGIKISRLPGEETIINETLLEMLRTQFKFTIPGLSPLPMDDSGVDVAQIMQIFRQSIKDMRGWEVREEACIGHFSFGKFVMWNDMTGRLDILQRHPLINHLMTGGGFFDDGVEVFAQEEVDRHVTSGKLFTPLSADSSQLAAVLYSEMGKNFVLHGPPGTGKSQTITNIIAHNLALGKKVLFVSEKKAALDVVHKRLSQIGLKPFCLELHSNKSGKAAVLAQFNEALQTMDSSMPSEWDPTIRELENLRKELDQHVQELHHHYPNGFSAYDCFSRLLELPAKDIPVIKPDIDLKYQSREEYLELRRQFAELMENWQLIDVRSLQALDKLNFLTWSPVMEKELSAAAAELLQTSRELEELFLRTAEMTEMDTLRQLSDVSNFLILAETAAMCGDIPAAFFSADIADQQEFLTGFAANARKLAALKEELHSFRLEKFADFDLEGVSKRIRDNNGSFFLLKFFKNRQLLKDVADLKKSGGVKLSVAELERILPSAAKYLSCLETYTRGREQAALLLGSMWQDENTRWDHWEHLLTASGNIRALSAELCGGDRELEACWLKKLQEIMPEITSRNAADAPWRKNIDALDACREKFQTQLKDFARFSAELSSCTGMPELISGLSAICGSIDDLRNTLTYRNLRNKFKDTGFMKVLTAVENASPLPADPQTIFDSVFFRTMLDQILAVTPGLCIFNGVRHDLRIKKFCETDARYMELTRRIIFSRLAANLPRRRSGPCPEGTELGILKRECEKRARQKPVRQLLEQIPTLAPLLKPCFLMSPLSVAQYLPPDTEFFDLIVFDEASQIPVWDAIGVIARCKQLIVVGDPRQMPPTNFFQKGESEDDAAPEDESDLESILDECIASGIHSAHLNWHYRSRHESLIAFSNHHYYDDRLCTFPAARESEKLGIRFEFVPDGVYDRRASRTNRKEAEALVRYIFDRLEKANGKYRSIGVVAFSQAQKDLIEDLLEKERAKHPALEQYFSDSSEETLFVKNLENVQGDERDVILFSIGYAADADGKFSMNFGPLNRMGGERRLNVAITRAREQVVVFSSIRAGDIDLNRSSAVGAAHLKYFLDYAERGVNIYTSPAEVKNDDGLTRRIGEFLTAHGYTVESDVGCSGYRIGLAVRDPDHPQEFLLGIECDNAVYAAQKTARDRDNLRRQVLAKLGWNICRIWCVDWALDRKRTGEKLLALLDELRQTPPPGAAPQPGSPVPAVPETEVSQTLPAAAPTAAPAAGSAEIYRCWVNNDVLKTENFHDPSLHWMIRQQYAEIIRQEAPICEHLLQRRLARAWGFNRITPKIQQILNDNLPVTLEITCSGEHPVYWSENLPPSQYKSYRCAAADDEKRSIDEIPPEEIANAMYELLVDFSSCPKETLFRETVKLFGLSVLTAKARFYLEYGFAVLQKSGRI